MYFLSKCVKSRRSEERMSKMPLREPSKRSSKGWELTIMVCNREHCCTTC